MVLTMGAHLAVSLRINSDNSAGVLDRASKPKVAKPSTTSLDANAALTAAFRRATTSGVALAGRKKANHSLCTMSLRPCSA